MLSFCVVLSGYNLNYILIKDLKVFLTVPSETFVLADEVLAKAFWFLETFVSVNSNSCGKLVSSLELRLTFDERFEATLVLLL